ncbi:hypothetical protein DPMN_179677 [Dreissena polymorpha]|uniref:Uncharacterized protein n=1 Tax=Dreissena polymorpha TaxID=45954 RepID=A0A9D4IMJ8_DREPO|nr:hypothetical protein DPMN_179677 [Dreissena polymorpha]
MPNLPRFVFDSYDDTEGPRTMDAIPNVNGITRFDYGYVLNQASEQAPTMWNTGLTQNVDLPVSTNHGGRYFVTYTEIIALWEHVLFKKTTTTTTHTHGNQKK